MALTHQYLGKINMKKVKFNILKITSDLIVDHYFNEWLYDRFNVHWRFIENKDGTLLLVSKDYDLTEFKLTWF